MNTALSKEICFGVIVGTRGFFNKDLAKGGRELLLKRLENLGFEYVILPLEATPTGLVETLQDAKKCAALFKENAEKIDGIIVSLPNFGDEMGIANAIKMSRLQVPVLLHAEDDDIDKVDVRHRRDSFCGKLSVSNNFYQYGIKFTDTSYHTCKVDGEEFKSDLLKFAAVCRTVRGLSDTRIGAIGARPAAFQTMRYSEKLLQAANISVITVDHSEIIFAAQKMDTKAEAVQKKLGEIRDYGKIPNRILEDNIVKQAKYSIAVEDWMAENEVDAASIQCWTSIQENYGCATCLTMSMLGEKLMPAACEVDVAGVISMYALTLAAKQPAALLDWNNNYGNDRNMCVNTHCSNFPKSFIGEPEIEISELDILGETLGRENCFGAIKGKVKAGPMTYFRMSTDDRKGRIKAYVGEGEFTDDPFGMDGGIAVCRVPNLQDLMKHMVRNGYEHHTAMVRTHTADILQDSIENYLDWDLYYHK